MCTVRLSFFDLTRSVTGGLVCRELWRHKEARPLPACGVAEQPASRAASPPKPATLSSSAAKAAVMPSLALVPSVMPPPLSTVPSLLPCLLPLLLPSPPSP